MVFHLLKWSNVMQVFQNHVCQLFLTQISSFWKIALRICRQSHEAVTTKESIRITRYIASIIDRTTRFFRAIRMTNIRADTQVYRCVLLQDGINEIIHRTIKGAVKRSENSLEEAPFRKTMIKRVQWLQSKWITFRGNPPTAKKQDRKNRKKHETARNQKSNVKKLYSNLEENLYDRQGLHETTTCEIYVVEWPQTITTIYLPVFTGTLILALEWTMTVCQGIYERILSTISFGG